MLVLAILLSVPCFSHTILLRYLTAVFCSIVLRYISTTLLLIVLRYLTTATLSNLIRLLFVSASCVVLWLITHIFTPAVARSTLILFAWIYVTLIWCVILSVTAYFLPTSLWNITTMFVVARFTTVACLANIIVLRYLLTMLCTVVLRYIFAMFLFIVLSLVATTLLLNLVRFTLTTSCAVVLWLITDILAPAIAWSALVLLTWINRSIFVTIVVLCKCLCANE